MIENWPNTLPVSPTKQSFCAYQRSSSLKGSNPPARHLDVPMYSLYARIISPIRKCIRVKDGRKLNVGIPSSFTYILIFFHWQAKFPIPEVIRKISSGSSMRIIYHESLPCNLYHGKYRRQCPHVAFANYSNVGL